MIRIGYFSVIAASSFGYFTVTLFNQFPLVFLLLCQTPTPSIFVCFVLLCHFLTYPIRLPTFVFFVELAVVVRHILWLIVRPSIAAILLAMGALRRIAGLVAPSLFVAIVAA